ncbi:MAG: hypothetical protein ACFB16_17270 [Phormidesmis sp.]
MNSRSNSDYSLEAEFHQTLLRHSSSSSFEAVAPTSLHPSQARSQTRSQTRFQRWIQVLLDSLSDSLFDSLFDFLLGAQSLSIRQTTGKNGASQWIVYEPTSNTRRVFDSEQDVRIWLEERPQLGI